MLTKKHRNVEVATHTHTHVQSRNNLDVSFCAKNINKVSYTI